MNIAVRKETTIICLLFVAFVILSFQPSAHGQSQTKYISIAVNEQSFSSLVGEAIPYINKKNRVMVPARIFTYFGISYDYLRFTNDEVIVNRDDLKVVFHKDRKTMVWNGEAITLESPPEFARTTLFVPLRTLAEKMGAKIQYDHWAKRVSIHYP
jgi:hypothetical protein